MGFKIGDGRGTAYEAEVKSDFRLQTASVTSDRPVVSNIENGEAFVLSTGLLTLAAATETRVAYLENAETGRNLVIDALKFFSDGGSTNYNKPTFAKIYSAPSAPTANDITPDAVAANTQSSKRLSSVYHVWDEAASGLVQATAGLLIMNPVFGVGYYDKTLPPKYAMGPTKAIGISMECPEAAEVGFEIWVHLE